MANAYASRGTRRCSACAPGSPPASPSRFLRGNRPSAQSTPPALMQAMLIRVARATTQVCFTRNSDCLSASPSSSVGICMHRSTSIASVVLINIPAPSVCRTLCLRSLLGFLYPLVTLARRRGMDLNCDTIKRLLPAWNCAGCICANLGKRGNSMCILSS